MIRTYVGRLIDIFVHPSTILHCVTGYDEYALRHYVCAKSMDIVFPNLDEPAEIYGSISYMGVRDSSDIDVLTFSAKVDKAQKHYLPVHLTEGRKLLLELVIISRKCPSESHWYGATGADDLTELVAPNGFYSLSIRGLWSRPSSPAITSLQLGLVRLVAFVVAKHNIHGGFHQTDVEKASAILEKIRFIFLGIASTSLSIRDNETFWKYRIQRGLGEVAVANICDTVNWIEANAPDVRWAEHSPEWSTSFQADRIADQHILATVSA